MLYYVGDHILHRELKSILPINILIPNYASGFILMPFCNDSDTSCIIWVDKIEVAAFSIRGKRIARWQLKEKYAEYSTKQNALEAAKKLTWFRLSKKSASQL
jgi:hypothetical protein